MSWKEMGDQKKPFEPGSISESAVLQRVSQLTTEQQLTNAWLNYEQRFTCSAAQLCWRGTKIKYAAWRDDALTPF